MGLFVVRARFEEEPPDEQELRSELQHWVGSDRGLDSVRKRSERELEIYTNMDAATRPYLLRVLSDRRAQILDFGTGMPLLAPLPSFVNVPWREIPKWKRLTLVIGFYLGLFSTTRRAGR